MSDVIHIDPERAAKTRARLDVISLEQALKDFEVANARVVDLTQRLLESERKRAEIANELEQLRLRGGVPQTALPPYLSTPASSQVARVTVKVARKMAREIVREFSRRFVK
jgi:hypothetical protein